MGYALLIFVYDKIDDAKTRTARLVLQHVIFVEKHRSADFQTTSGLRRLLGNNANRDDILAFFEERMLPVRDLEAEALAEEVLRRLPEVGYINGSTEQFRPPLFSRASENAGQIPGLLRLN